MSYVWDLNASLPVILQDTDGNRYVYGLDLLTRVYGTDEEWYLYDGLGSTTGLADGAGTVTGTYTYDVFGAVRSHTGDATEWSYTGEQNDSTGLEYLRARYYDAGTGRFLAQDPLPLLQRYSYVFANPTNMTDPSGLCAFGLPCPDKVEDAKECVQNGGDCVIEPIKKAERIVREDGANLSKALNQLAFEIDLAAAAAVDTVTGAYCAASVLSGAGVATCPVFYLAASAVASPVMVGSNLISAASTMLSCYGTLRNPYEGGMSLDNIIDCGMSAVVTTGGSLTLDPNISLALNYYTVCRDKGDCWP